MPFRLEITTPAVGDEDMLARLMGGLGLEEDAIFEDENVGENVAPASIMGSEEDGVLQASNVGGASGSSNGAKAHGKGRVGKRGKNQVITPGKGKKVGKDNKENRAVWRV